MHLDVLNGVTADFESARRLKVVFQQGWNHPDRVKGWVGGALHAEFHDPGCRQAWKDALSEAAGTTPSDRALDLGTGPGTISSMWAELGFRTTAIDFAPNMLEAGQRLAAERGLTLEFIEGDAEDPPVGERRFGVISTRFVLYTLPHPGYAIRRWVQLLEPGGKLVLIGHDRDQGQASGSTEVRAPRKHGWQVGEDYRAALDRLPFMDHKASDLQVVMEAAGMSEIRKLAVTGLDEARERLREDQPEVPVGSTTPYIVVGRK
ncbi:class I SAM-dependent methyltransferase [Haloferula sargassicola]|uniref:2-methoxy-6-polyprenyl-1,4-benzoquinol methylase, mitochondrial n=1 Tax=Haloferula sargassicola TaxID=490096 RepID=A0ABP9UNM4_9BACT